eukprot:3841187-Rhodomonas_salina.1
MTKDQIRDALLRQNTELVFTAHPTQAARRWERGRREEEGKREGEGGREERGSREQGESWEKEGGGRE